MGKVFHRHPYLCLVFICLISYSISLFHLPVTDRDEGRFVQATKQMVESGDYLTIKFQDEFRNKKPAGIYWLQALCVKLSGQELNSVWPYRLPSLFSALFSVLLTYFFASHLFGRSIARNASLFLASSTVLIVEATTAKTDSALLLATVSSMGLLALGYQDNQKRIFRSILLGISLAAGAMIKGPLIFFFLSMVFFSLLLVDSNRQWIKNFHWPLIILIPIAVVMPWFLLIQKATSGQFAQDSLGHDFAKKILSAQEGHGAPPGFFTLSLFVGLWSAVIWIFPTLIQAWKERKAHKNLLFCLCATIPSLCVLEFIPTKLIHYPLPLYPWLAMIAAWGFHHQRDIPNSHLQKVCRYFFIFISLILSIVFPVISYNVKGTLLTQIIAIFLGVSLFLAALITIRTHRPYTILGALVIFPCVLSFWLPHLSILWVSEKIYQEIKDDLPSHPSILLMGYGEPSAVFRLGTSIVMSRKEESLVSILNTSYGHIFIDKGLIKGEIKNLLSYTPKIRWVNEIAGLNYNKMKKVYLQHYIVNPE